MFCLQNAILVVYVGMLFFDDTMRGNSYFSHFIRLLTFKKNVILVGDVPKNLVVFAPSMYGKAIVIFAIMYVIYVNGNVNI